MIKVVGKNGITATILAHSVSPDGVVFLTYELIYPRLVLSELNTHRMLSKNSFSSRAVPFLKMLEQLNGEPVRYGANQSGMQDRGDDFDADVMVDEQLEYDVPYKPSKAWEKAKKLAISIARAFYEAGYHKQVYNRLLEPWQLMKTVLSGTEFDNFFWLRDDDAADPTLRELARVMKEALEQSTAELLQPGHWHLPYLNVVYFQNADGSREQSFYIEERFEFVGPNQDKVYPHLTLEQAIKVSCARCAAVSYRNEGYGLEKSIEVYDRLVGSDKKHASAFEHCAKVMQPFIFDHGFSDDYVVNEPTDPDTWEEGITHMDRQKRLWSGNLRGYIQYRKLIPGENYEG